MKTRLTSLILMSLLIVSVFVGIAQCVPADYVGVEEGDEFTYAVEIKNSTETKTYEVIMTIEQLVDETSYVNLTVGRESDDVDMQESFEEQANETMWRYAIINSTFEEITANITDPGDALSAIFLAIFVMAFIPQAYFLNTNRVNKSMTYVDEEDGTSMEVVWNDQGVLESFLFATPEEENPPEIDTYKIDLKAGGFNLLEWIKNIPGFPVGILLGIGGSAVVLVVMIMKKYTYSHR